MLIGEGATELGGGGPGLLAELKADPGRLGLETLLGEIGKLERVRTIGVPEDLFTDVSEVTLPLAAASVGEGQGGQMLAVLAGSRSGVSNTNDMTTSIRPPADTGAKGHVPLDSDLEGSVVPWMVIVRLVVLAVVVGVIHLGLREWRATTIAAVIVGGAWLLGRVD